MTLSPTAQQRAEALLHLADRPGATETEPVLRAGEVGASGAVAYAWSDPGVTASVYEFNDYYEADAGESTLRAYRVDSTVAVRASVNGGLLIWLEWDPEDLKAKRWVTGLVSDFAGRE